jgi:hypothetical protein
MQAPPHESVKLSDRERAAAALGRPSASVTLGTSPPGSFENEVLVFMSSMSPSCRSRRRSSRRKSKRVHEWPGSCYLRRLNLVHSPPCTAPRRLRGVWQAMHPDGVAGGLQLAVIIDVVYHPTCMGVEVLALRPAQGGYPELAEWKFVTTGAAIDCIDSSVCASSAAHELLRWFAEERGHCSWTVRAPHVLAADGVKHPTLKQAVSRELAAAAAVVACGHRRGCSPEASSSSVVAEGSLEQVAAGISVGCGGDEGYEDVFCPSGQIACDNAERASACRHAMATRSQKQAGEEEVGELLQICKARDSASGGVMNGSAASQTNDQGDGLSCIATAGVLEVAGGCDGGVGVSEQAEDKHRAQGESSTGVQEEHRHCVQLCDWQKLAASAVARHGRVQTSLGGATLFELSLGRTGIDGLLLVWAPHARAPDPQLYRRLVDPV